MTTQALTTSSVYSTLPMVLFPFLLWLPGSSVENSQLNDNVVDLTAWLNYAEGEGGRDPLVIKRSNRSPKDLDSLI